MVSLPLLLPLLQLYSSRSLVRHPPVGPLRLARENPAVRRVPRTRFPANVRFRSRPHGL